MNCQTCARRTTSLFTRVFASTESIAQLRATIFRCPPPSRFFSAASRLPVADQSPTEPPKPFATNKSQDEASVEKKRESWQIQKEAVKQKLGGAAWNPRKKLSPDTMEGIRHLHMTHPEKFTTPVLAQHFKVSPEAIRRILKSKWRPSDEEQEERLRRWDKRGEKIWSNLVELGVKPPKKWRNMGVGRVKKGERPKWKSTTRNTVDVRDSFSEDIIPIVDGSGEAKLQMENTSLTERI